MHTLKKSSLAILLANFAITTYATGVLPAKKIATTGMALVREALLVKPIEPEKEIQFVVWLKPRNKAKLDKIVNDIYNIHSLNYHKFLTAEEINQQFTPTLDAENAVQKFFADQNMQATIVDHRVEVVATAEQVEKSLQTTLNYYRYKNQTGYANATEPKLTASIAPHVLAISGLNNLVKFKPHYQNLTKEMEQQRSLQVQDINMVWDSFIPSVQPTTTSIGGFSGAHIRTAYDVANIPNVNSSVINGAGQTIVITASCGAHSPSQIMSEANVYNAANGLPLFSAANFAVVNADGTPFTTCGATTRTGWETEIALGVEATHTLAPNANVVLVLNRNSRNLDKTLSTLVNHLINNNYTIAGFSNAKVVSNSWGTEEGFGFWPIEPLLEMAASNGISFNFSTGDCGDGAYDSPSCFGDDGTKTVEYPASSAFVTAVGGTSMFVGNNWTYAFETVWGTYLNNSFYSGSGGGISKYFGPVAWQEVIKFFEAGGYGTINDFSKRAIPDIAMLGDPLTGLRIFEGGSWSTVGGTGLANSLFSATLTLTNQVLTLKNKPQLGLAAPLFYTQNSPLLHSQSLNSIHAPHQIISGATLPPAGAPTSAFTIFTITMGWNSSLTITPADQFWNDAVGVGTPNLPKFVPQMATF